MTITAGVTTRSNGAAVKGAAHGLANGATNGAANGAANGVAKHNGAARGARDAKAKALEEGFEFGGTWGALALIVWSHAQLYYFWYCITHNNASLVVTDWADFAHQVRTGCAPTARTVGAYVLFIVVQAVLAMCVPGHEVQGYPLPHLGGVRLSYCCNGLGCWTLSLAGLAALHMSGAFDLAGIQADLGAYMTSAIIVADVTAIGAYVGALCLGTQHRMSGHRLYDFFMGAPLNPRIGSLDLKMFAEARVSWIVLFLLTLSAALLQLRRHGSISGPMCLMVLAHGLYTHTIMRGEEGIPVTWDIFYEKWGWMLIFWNLAGVPFTYCYQSIYLASLPPFEHSAAYTAATLLLLLAGWYVWDVSNSQRCYFRMQQEGTFRWRIGLFLPWLPGRFLKVRALRRVRRPAFCARARTRRRVAPHGRARRASAGCQVHPNGARLEAAHLRLVGRGAQGELHGGHCDGE